MELWCVTAFFAPFESELRYKNFELFAQSIVHAGVNLLTVELLYPWTTRRLPHIGHKETLEATDVLWHKEAMINHGFSLLPASCDIAMYMDCDLIFEDTDWVELLKERAQTHDVIQCFRTCHHLQEGDTSKSVPPIHSFDGIAYYKETAAMSQEEPCYLKKAPGGSWAFTKPYFRSAPLYDRIPFGITDHFSANYFLDILDTSPHLQLLTPPLREDVLQWAAQQPPVQSVAFLPVDAWHLWHGSLKDRRYLRPWDILEKHAFDPNTDIQKRNGVFQWASQKPDLHHATLQHFLEVEKHETMLT